MNSSKLFDLFTDFQKGRGYQFVMEIFLCLVARNYSTTWPILTIPDAFDRKCILDDPILSWAYAVLIQTKHTSYFLHINNFF